MATTAANVAPTNGTDAEFRAWAQFVHDVFANGGWTQTGDTGQINLATVTRPLATNTKSGYEVWAMADSLQSTNPVILKIAYGSSNGAANQPAMWFMVGTATDGAGNLIDANDANRPAWLIDAYSQTIAPIASRAASATLHTSFGSATTSRAVFAIFEAKPTLQFTGSACEFVNVTGPDTAAPGNFINAFSIERSRDINGDETGDFVIVVQASTVINSEYYARTSNAFCHTVAHFAGVSARPPGTAVIYANYKASLMPANGDAAVYAMIPFESGAAPRWPGINMVISPNPLFDFDDDPGNCTIAFNSGYVTGRTAEASPYGTARTYRTVAGLRGAQQGTATSEAGAFVFILYE